MSRATMLAAAGISDPEEVVAITSETIHEDLGDMIDEVRSQRRSAEARLAPGFIEDASGANALAKLSRYETTLFNRRNQALAQLTTLQAAHAANMEGGRMSFDRRLGYRTRGGSAVAVPRDQRRRQHSVVNGGL